MLDISKLAVADTADCELNGPDGKPLLGADGKRASITMFGPASREFAAMKAAQNERLVEELGKGADRKPYTADENIRLTADDLCMVTKSFNNFSYGKPDQFATPKEMWHAAYSDIAIGWLRDQANAFFGKWGNFPPVSSGK